MVVAPKNQNGTFGTTILTLTDASDPATVGKIYIGWVDMGEGVLPTGGDLVPSNGVIAIYVPAVKTAALTAADFVNAEGKPAGWYDLLLVKSAYKKALLKGSVTLDMEPS